MMLFWIGIDIDAGCGQLKAELLRKKKTQTAIASPNLQTSSLETNRVEKDSSSSVALAAAAEREKLFEELQR